jgi:hypothetical protein
VVVGGVHMAQLLRNFKGELRKVLEKVTKGGEGVQNGEKMRYVIFERPLLVCKVSLSCLVM